MNMFSRGGLATLFFAGVAATSHVGAAATATVDCAAENPAGLDAAGQSRWKPESESTLTQQVEQVRKLAKYFSDIASTWATQAPASRMACEAQLLLALGKAKSPVVSSAAPIALRQGTNELDAALKKDSTGVTPTLKEAVVVAVDAAQQAVDEAAKDSGRARFGLYGGANYTLTPEGDWNSGTDVFARFDSRKFGYPEWTGGSSFRGFFELGYFTRGGKEPAEPATEPTVPPETPPAAAEGSQKPEFINPFESNDGVFSAQMGLNAIFLSNWTGVGTRIGGETVPTKEASSSFTQFKPFGALGFVAQDTYLDGAIGEVFVGYAHDERWRKDVTGEDEDATERVLLTGLLQLPGLDDKLDFRLSGRLYVSVPLEGGDSTEVRISLLLAYDPSDWINGVLGP